ncbi:MAG: AraC family transcriptional regulator [Pseudomonadota bacterium]
MTVDYEARLQRVITYIHDNPAGDLSLDCLADVAAMSRFHWHRVFRAMTGETCAAAVKRIRMHLAANALVSSDRPVAEIAVSVGYPQIASFSRAFSDAYRCAPARFRAEGKATTLAIHRTKGDLNMYDVSIRDLDGLRLASLPHRGAYPEIGRVFQTLYATIGARGYFDKIGSGVGVYFDDPMSVPEAELRSVAGATLLGDAAVPDGLEAYDIPASRSAVLTFKGPYSGLATAWDYFYGPWLSSAGERPADAPSYEIYLNDPTNTAPHDLITELVMPLQ